MTAQKDLPGALASYREALADRQKSFDLHSGGDESFYDVGDTLTAMGDGKGALQSYQASLAIAREMVADKPDGEARERVVISQTRAVDTQLDLGDLNAALASFRESLDVSKGLAAAEPVNTRWQRNTARAHRSIGDVQKRQGDPGAAVESHQSSLALWQALATLEPANTDWQLQLVSAHWRLGMIEGAGSSRELRRAHLSSALDLAGKLQQQGVLASQQKAWPDRLRKPSRASNESLRMPDAFPNRQGCRSRRAPGALNARLRPAPPAAGRP